MSNALKNAKPDSAKTKPEVFIIESLGFDDERNSRLEGKVLSGVLRMCGKEPPNLKK